MSNKETYLKTRAIIDVVYDLDASNGLNKENVRSGLYNVIANATGSGLLTGFNSMAIVDSHSVNIIFPEDQVSEEIEANEPVTLAFKYHEHHHLLSREACHKITPAVTVVRSCDKGITYFLMYNQHTSQWNMGYYELGGHGQEMITDIESFPSFEQAKRQLASDIGGVFEDLDHRDFNRLHCLFPEPQFDSRSVKWAFSDAHLDLDGCASVIAYHEETTRRVFMSYMMNNKVFTVGLMHRPPGHEDKPYERSIMFEGLNHEAALRVFFEKIRVDINTFDIETGPVGTFLNHVSARENFPIIMYDEPWKFKQFDPMTGGPTATISGVLGGVEVIAYITFDPSISEGKKRWFCGYWYADNSKRSDPVADFTLDSCLMNLRLTDPKNKISKDEGLKSLLTALVEYKASDEPVDIGHGKVFGEKPVSFTSCHYELDYHPAIHGFVDVAGRRCLAFLCFDEDRNPPWEVGAWVYDGHPDPTCEYEQKGHLEFKDAVQAFIDIFKENKQYATGMQEASRQMLEHAMATVMKTKLSPESKVKIYEDNSRIDFYSKDSECDDQGVLMFSGKMEDHKLVYRQDNGPAYLEIVHTKYRPGVGLNDKSSVDVKDTWSMSDAIAEMLRIKNITPNDLEKSVVQNFTDWVKNQIRQKYDRDMELFN